MLVQVTVLRLQYLQLCLDANQVSELIGHAVILPVIVWRLNNQQAACVIARTSRDGTQNLSISQPMKLVAQGLGTRTFTPVAGITTSSVESPSSADKSRNAIFCRRGS